MYLGGYSSQVSSKFGEHDTRHGKNSCLNYDSRMGFRQRNMLDVCRTFAIKHISNFAFDLF